MNTQKLFLKIMGCALVSALVLAFAACPSPSGGDDEPPPPVISNYNDDPITAFTGTRWSDGQIPEDTITFSATQITLEGRYFKKRIEVNGAQRQVDFSGPHPYNVKAPNEVESPYTSYIPVDAESIVNVILNESKQIGIQMYLYRADTNTGKHQRLIVYSTAFLQPREFYLPK